MSTEIDIKAIREGLLAWKKDSLSPNYEKSLLEALERIENSLCKLREELENE